MFATWQDLNPNCRRRQSVTHEKDQYFPYYIQPSQPDPSFTFDFALPTSSSANTLIFSHLHRSSSWMMTAATRYPPPLQDHHLQLLIQKQVTATLLCAKLFRLEFSSTQPSFPTKAIDVFGVYICDHIIGEKCRDQTISSSCQWFTFFTPSNYHFRN